MNDALIVHFNPDLNSPAVKKAKTTGVWLFVLAFALVLLPGWAGAEELVMPSIAIVLMGTSFIPSLFALDHLGNVEWEERYNEFDRIAALVSAEIDRDVTRQEARDLVFDVGAVAIEREGLPSLWVAHDLETGKVTVKSLVDVA